jgi:predicted dehydrogenase
MSEENKIRVGLVGVGSWGRYGHIPALKLLPYYEIVAIASRSLDTASKLAAEFEIPNAFGDYKQLVEAPCVDLVVVLPPAPQHADIVKAAIANGKDIYCEWPLTTNTKSSDELLRLADKAGVRHFVGLQRTAGASSLLLSNLLATQFAGELRSVRMHVSMSGFGPVRSASLDWTLPAINFSNILSIYGGHFMDMLFHAAGQPVELSAIVKTQFPDVSAGTGPKISNESADAVMVMGTLQNGALFQVHIEGGKLNPTGLRIEITGTGGDLEVINDRSFVTKQHDLVRGARGAGGIWQEISVPDQYRTIPQSDLDVSVQDLAQLYAAFARDRSTGSKSVRDFADAVAVHLLIDAILDSASSSKTVVLKGRA